MSLSKLKQQIKSNNFDSIFVFFGKEDFLRESYIKAVEKGLCVEELAEFNYHKFDADKMDARLFSITAHSYPVMSDKRLIMINNLLAASLKGELKSALEEVFLDFPSYLVLIFNYSDNSFEFSKQATLKEFLKDATVVEFSKPRQSELISWVKRHFNAQKKAIDNEAVIYFLSVCQNDMNIMKNEIAKVCAYAKGESVCKEDIDAQVVKSFDFTVFSLGDALLEKKYDRAFCILDSLLTQKNDPILIAAYLCSVFVNLFKLKCAAEAGLAPEAGAAQAGINRYVALRYQKYLKSFDKAFLKKSIAECKNTDIALKRSRVDKQSGLYILLGKIINLQKG